MSVPNTNTFALSDVVNEINPSMSPKSLGQCFSEAIAYKFDSQYSGSKDRLSNFRNYGRNITTSFEAYTSYGEDSIDGSGASWTDARDAYSGSLVNGSNYPITVSKDFEDATEIIRFFVTFDLSSIPSNAEIVEAYLEMRIINEHSSGNDIVGIKGGQGISLDSNDFHTGDRATTFFSGTYSTWQDGGGNNIIKKMATSGDLNNIKSYFGSKIPVCVQHKMDYNNTAPSDIYIHGYDIWKSGELLSDEFGTPAITIIYK